MRVDNKSTAATAAYNKTVLAQIRDKKRAMSAKTPDFAPMTQEYQPEAALLTLDTIRTAAQATTQQETAIQEPAVRETPVREAKDPAEYYRKLSEELEKSKAQSDAAGEAYKELILCLRIAMRIISGNKVPIEDQKFLQEKNPELYGKAMLMRVHKRDPEEYDRLTEDEEEEHGTNNSVSAERSESVRLGDTSELQPEPAAEELSV